MARRKERTMNDYEKMIEQAQKQIEEAREQMAQLEEQMKTFTGNAAIEVFGTDPFTSERAAVRFFTKLKDAYDEAAARAKQEEAAESEEAVEEVTEETVATAVDDNAEYDKDAYGAREDDNKPGFSHQERKAVGGDTNANDADLAVDDNDTADDESEENAPVMSDTPDYFG